MFCTLRALMPLVIIATFPFLREGVDCDANYFSTVTHSPLVLTKNSLSYMASACTPGK